MEEGPGLKVKHGHRDVLRIRGSLLLQCAPLAVGVFCLLEFYSFSLLLGTPFLFPLVSWGERSAIMEPK